jgi:uncharacterized repeat protein (TIGR02543 family)
MRVPVGRAVHWAVVSWLVALVAACLALAPAAGATVTVAPIPKIHAVKAVYHIKGRSQLLLESLELYGIPGLRRQVSCNHCLRLPTRTSLTHPTPDSTLYSGVNWLLAPGRAVPIGVYRPGQVGRFVRLAAEVGGKPALVFSASGCLESFGHVERCPSDTVAPTPGSVVPPAPTVAPAPAGGASGPTLTVSVGGAGAGTVAGAGISCPTTCSASLASGASATLTAVATAGSTFTGWSGACAGTGACKVTMDGDQKVTASFAAASDDLTVSLAGTGSGTVTGGGISCPSACSKGIAPGAGVSLVAAAASGSTFTGWGGACGGTGACNVTMSGDRSVTATFTLLPHQLTITLAGSGSGTVSGAGISCPGTCTGSYASGSTVTLTASGQNGSSFAGWSGGCTGTGGCSVTMGADQSVTADFTAPAPAPVPPASPPPPTYYVHHVYGTCRDGACGLKVRTAPSVSASVTHVILDGTEVDIVCQATGDLVSNGSASSNIWDRQTDGSWFATATSTRRTWVRGVRRYLTVSPRAPGRAVQSVDREMDQAVGEPD